MTNMEAKVKVIKSRWKVSNYRNSLNKHGDITREDLHWLLDQLELYRQKFGVLEVENAV